MHFLIDMLMLFQRLLQHLKANGVPIAVATSSTRPKMMAKTKFHQELFELFDGHITCGDDAEIKRGKPAPDLFLAAREKFVVEEQLPDVERCLVFEDALNGIEAARNAGMPTIWVPGKCPVTFLSGILSRDYSFTDPNLRKLERPAGFVEPVETLNSLEEFNPEKYGLPAWNT